LAKSIGLKAEYLSIGLSIVYKLNVIMLFMLTPEIKTNLILKEIGIKRYSLRSKINNSPNHDIYFYQKGVILSLLNKPYENFVKEQQELIKAILASTNLDKGNEKSKKISIQSEHELKKIISKLSDIRLIIIFGKVFNSELFLENSIQAPSINELFLKKSLKKDLWLKIKSKLNL